MSMKMSSRLGTADRSVSSFRQERVGQPKVQPKTAAPSQNRKPPVAPPVYRSQPVPRVLQSKITAQPQRINQSSGPVAPPVYRSQPVPRVLQGKIAAQPQRINQSSGPVAPPIYRP